MNFNHINKSLSEEQVTELKKLFETYHQKMIDYKKQFKRNKALNLGLNMTSVVLVSTGTVVSAITMNPIILATISGLGVVIQTVMTKKKLSKKVETCRFAYTAYQKVLNELKLILRSGHFNEELLLQELNWIDDQVVDLCTI